MTVRRSYGVCSAPEIPPSHSFPPPKSPEKSITLIFYFGIFPLILSAFRPAAIQTAEAPRMRVGCASKERSMGWSRNWCWHFGRLVIEGIIGTQISGNNYDYDDDCNYHLCRRLHKQLYLKTCSNDSSNRYNFVLYTQKG
jgi:hypothetical protein